MNYENLYQEMLQQKKSFQNDLETMKKLFRSVTNELESGDVKAMTKDLAAMSGMIGGLGDKLTGMEDTLAGFDSRKYFEDGDFAAQILEICQEKGVDVKGTFPVYEMFPYKVKIDAENQDIYMNNKKVPCMRPAKFVEKVQKEQERLKRTNFNATTFASELENAYDLLALKGKSRDRSPELYLKDLYKYLAPMGRLRKVYDMQNYAYDVAKLYDSDERVTKSGIQFEFGPTRISNRSLRIIDQYGKEQYLSTIQFFYKD